MQLVNELFSASERKLCNLNILNLTAVVLDITVVILNLTMVVLNLTVVILNITEVNTEKAEV